MIHSCSLKKNESQTFLLTYNIDVEIVNKSLPTKIRDYINVKYGDSINVKYDELGNVSFYYLNSGENGLKYQLFDNQSHQTRVRWNNIDTVYFYDHSVNSLNFLSKQEKREFKENCIEYTGVDIFSGDTVVQKYCYVEDSLKTSPNLYSSFDDLFFGEFMTISDCLPTRTVMRSKSIILTKTLVRAVRTKKQDLVSLDVDKSLPSKKL